VLAPHALLIHRVMSDLVVEQRSRGFDVGVDDDGTPFARPKSKTKGPARELYDLARTCRKAVAGKISLKGWTKEWAAQPERIKALWKPVRNADRSIDRSQIAMSFITHSDASEAKGNYYATVAPKPEIVLPVIETASRKITANPNEKTRKSDKYEAYAIAAIRTAYRAITGNSGGRVIRNGRLAGKLVALRREIGSIFGTELFAVKDSTQECRVLGPILYFQSARHDHQDDGG
jgi:hypothetical protein